LKAGSGNIQEPSNFRSWLIVLSRIEGQLRTDSRSFKVQVLANWTLKNLRPAQYKFKSLETGEAGQLDSQELKAGSGHIQEPSNWRSWLNGFSRIESRLRTHSRAFKQEELAN
jgi:hypothetical protein